MSAPKNFRISEYSTYSHDDLIFYMKVKDDMIRFKDEEIERLKADLATYKPKSICRKIAFTPNHQRPKQ